MDFRTMKKLLLGLWLLCAPSIALAQCNGVFPNNTACGNISGGSNTPRAIPLTSFPGNVPGGSNGQIQFNNSGAFGGLTDAQVTSRVAGTSGGGTTNFLRADGAWAAPPLTPSYDAISNCTISVTNPSNALSIAVKTAAGNTPSTSDSCVIPFRDVTATAGDYTTVVVTSAVTFSTGTSGSTFGSSNNVPFRLWITLWNNAGTVSIGVSMQTTALTTFPLFESAPASTTACSACTNATTAGTFYTTSALTSKAFRVFGYMDWGSGLVTAGTYATLPTLVALKTNSTPLPGYPIQSASGSQSSASQTSTTSASYAPTTTVATLSPVSAIDPVVCSFYGTTQVTTVSTIGFVALLRGGTLIGSAQEPFSAGGQTNWPTAATVRDLPGTTGSTSYTVNIKSDGTHTIIWAAGGGDSGAGVSCTEIAG